MHIGYKLFTISLTHLDNTDLHVVKEVGIRRFQCGVESGEVADLGGGPRPVLLEDGVGDHRGAQAYLKGRVERNI